MSTITTETSAYLPSVWKNAYRYDDISANSIVFKSSASSFGSIAAPAFGTDDAKPKVLQIAKGTADGSIAYQWVDPAAASFRNLSNKGVLVSSADKTVYDISGMDDTSFYAVALKYDGTKYVAQQLTSIVSVSATADGNYYLAYNNTDSTWSAVALSSDDKAFIVRGGSYVEATASNLFSITTPAQNQMLVLTTTGYATANLPTEQGEYHLVLSEANALPTFVKNSNNDAGGNLTVNTTLSAFTSLAATATNIFDAFTTTNGYNYKVTVNMDIYVADITKLVSTTLSDADFINALPEVVIKAGTETIASYTVKTNQPLQSIAVSKVISATAATSGAITAEIKFGTVPPATENFIKIAKLNSVFGTYQSCGLTPSP